MPFHLRTFWLILIIFCRAYEYRRIENLEGIKARRRENHYDLRKINKGKAIPVTRRGGPQGCETLRLPHLL
jgi:hypothetical protein